LPVEQEQVAGQNTWLEKGFELTDSLLSWCKANHMYLILDLHAAPGGQGNDLNISDRDSSKPSLWQSTANQQKTVALWRKLAQRYANEPMIAGYDILNEPNWGFEDQADRNGTKEKTNAPLLKLLKEITAAIREVDKKHIIIIEGNGWGNNYNGMLPPWDKNMVLSFHKYWNTNDEASISHILKARDQYNVPVWLGETGENSNVWYTQAIRLLEGNNIGWAWWPLKKLGANNPLQIKSNLNYDAVVNYWNGRGRKPNESNAYSGLMELATYTRIETNILHRDVIDALFRQPFTTATKPFAVYNVRDSLVIQAVDYDLGRNGYAYYDTDTADYWVSGQRSIGNKGRIYRNDGVDIRKDSSRYERYYVSDMETGEWLQYTVEVATKGIYTISLDIASDTSGTALSLQLDGSPPVPAVDVPVTGNYKTWQEIGFLKMPLKAGKQTIRLFVTKGPLALRKLVIRKNR
ncbi:MAG TPA: cellulase family glycosylhydrolase, partial [Flavisolibacter sp.]|nr:cellulase family glycosylhydrolase [Flavisolibacter sp.]